MLRHSGEVAVAVEPNEFRSSTKKTSTPPAATVNLRQKEEASLVPVEPSSTEMSQPAAETSPSMLAPPPPRDVCVMQNAQTCAPIWCDDRSPASWSGRIIRTESQRGLRMKTSGSARSGSGCAVSDEYRFIYVHVLKSGGMTFKGTLREAMCDGGRFDDKNKRCEPSAGGPRRLTVQDCSLAVRSNPDYFVFSFVRNPFSRWFSAYSMGVAYSRQPEQPFALSFKEFLERPSAMSRHSKVNSAHWTPQTSFILDSKGCPVLDFVGHLENLDEDFMQVVDLIGRPKQLVQFLETNGGLRRASGTAYGDKAKEIRQKDGSAAAIYTPDNIELISKLSEEEFSLLGYDAHSSPA